MGHIVHSEDDYNYLKNLVFEIKDNDFDKDKVIQILGRILPKDENGNLLIKYNVREKGSTTAIFIPRYEIIEVSINKINTWLDRNTSDLAEMYEVEDKNLLRSYLFLMVLMHETEHAYQYLIGKGIIEEPCKMLQQGYKALTELLVPKDYILPRPIKQVRRAISIINYKRKENEYLLERNAQFDSLGTLSDIAFQNEHHEVRGVLLDMRSVFAMAGYTKNVDGPLVNTFKEIHMKDILKKMDQDYENLDMMDRYRLGLPVNERTRERILALRK